jgi:mono/diheme cytochrome c family protein
VLIALAACQQQAKQALEPAEISFDGAEIAEASAKVAHGRRIADVLGCTGCHGAGLQGERFYELYASNLTRDLHDYSDVDIARVLRDGVPRNRRDLWGMPSEIFQHLSESDMAALTAYLRSLSPAGAPTEPPLAFPPEVRELIAKGEIKPAAAFVIDTRRKGPVELGPQHVLGRYITRVTCAECHGPELKGSEGDTPDLLVAGGYTREEFERLMTEGLPSGGRKLKPLMELVAKERFAKMTRHERDALYAYLKARAEQPQ